MDNGDAVSAFLRSRRDKISPQQADLPVYGQRRVPGLRRGEVAMLAGVSVAYYTRLERGNLRGVSDSVLDVLAQALRLDDTERMYLYSLARAAGPAPEARARQREVRPTVRPSVARIVEAMPELPAYGMNNRLDTLAANPLGRALYSEMYADPTCGANVALSRTAHRGRDLATPGSLPSPTHPPAADRPRHESVPVATPPPSHRPPLPLPPPYPRTQTHPT
jgi:transcriptional regulator with XRE-family HTH domain